MKSGGSWFSQNEPPLAEFLNGEADAPIQFGGLLQPGKPR